MEELRGERKVVLGVSAGKLTQDIYSRADHTWVCALVKQAA
jgi:hypothetical protein